MTDRALTSAAWPRAALPVAAALLAAATLLAVGCDGKKGKRSRRRDAGVVQKAKVRLTSTPSNAAVFFEGRRRLGRTPMTLERPVGRSIELLFVKEGRQRIKRAVHFEQAGDVQRVHVTLPVRPATVVVSTGPLRGVRVRIDGKDRGRSPVRVLLERGVKHRLQLNKPGHHPYSEHFVVPKGKHGMRFEISLPPRSLMKYPVGWLSIASDVPALVYLDGKLLGSAPLDRRPMRAGKHRLRLKSSAVAAQKKLVVKVVAGVHQRVSVSLRPPDAGVPRRKKKK